VCGVTKQNLVLSPHLQSRRENGGEQDEHDHFANKITTIQSITSNMPFIHSFISWTKANAYLTQSELGCELVRSLILNVVDCLKLSFESVKGPSANLEGITIVAVDGSSCSHVPAGRAVGQDTFNTIVFPRCIRQNRRDRRCLPFFFHNDDDRVRQKEMRMQ